MEEVHEGTTSLSSDVDSPSLLTPWTLEPLQVVPTVLAALPLLHALPHARRAGAARARLAAGDVLDRHRARRPRAQLADRRARRGALLLPAHDQHVILGDLAPLCFVLGLTGQVLRPVLRFKVVERLRVLAHPFVALPLWAFDLYIWHVPYFYDSALASRLDPRVRALLLLHGGLPDVGAGARDAAGACVVRHRHEVRLHRRRASARDDPRQRLHLVVERLLHRVPPPAGVGHHAGARLESRRRRDDGRGLARHRGRPRLAVLRLAHEGEVRQQLLEQGLDPRQVRRAVRYGRADELVKPSRT